MSISVPNSYSNNDPEHASGDMIKLESEDAFHEDSDDDSISLEGLDDDDISTTIPDASTCIVCCILTLDHECNLNHVVTLLQICHKRPPYSKGGRSYPTCGLTCASILASGATNAPSHRTGWYRSSNSSSVQNALQSRVSPAIIRPIKISAYRLNRELKALPMECAPVLED